MKYRVRSRGWLLFILGLVECLTQASAISDGDSIEDSSFEEEDSSKQQGSWVHWWSYDGISGPDYWNINKRWRLCALGRKQSPVEIRTDRLVYDHLLGSIKLSWLDESGNSQADQNGATDQSDASDLQRPVRVQLLNSGRGLEAWLEPTAGAGPSDQLILSHGPLSYAYKLFKLELHSARNPTQQQPERSPKWSPESEESVPETLRLGKSSEHLIDGRAFDAELQLHFYNRHLADSARHAQQLASGEEARPNLFAAISVLVQAVNSTLSGGGALSFLLDNTSLLAKQGDSVQLMLNRRHIEALVPERQQYVTYQGSQNRPPCAESVDWILINRPLQVEIDKLGLLFSDKLNTNQENIRPIKPLYRRLLRTTINNNLASKRQEETTSGCSTKSEQRENCTNSETRLQSDQTNRRTTTTTKWPSDRQIQCSMKPNYAYQLRYSTIGHL